jgi:hypothetical protein
MFKNSIVVNNNSSQLEALCFEHNLQIEALEKAVGFLMGCKVMSEIYIEELESDAEWNHSIVDKVREKNKRLNEVVTKLYEENKILESVVNEANINSSKLKKKHNKLRKKYNKLVQGIEPCDPKGSEIPNGHVIEIKLCNHTFKKGSRKGSKCQIKVGMNKEFCAKHDKAHAPSKREVKNQCTKKTKSGDRCRRACMFSLVEGCKDRLDCCYSHRNVKSEDSIALNSPHLNVETPFNTPLTTPKLKPLSHPVNESRSEVDSEGIKLWQHPEVSNAISEINTPLLALSYFKERHGMIKIVSTKIDTNNKSHIEIYNNLIDTFVNSINDLHDKCRGLGDRSRNECIRKVEALRLV